MQPFRGSLGILALAAAAASLAGMPEERVQVIDRPVRRPARPAPPASSYTHWRGSRYAPNSDRETARRRRQIAAGQLTRANGLVS